MSRVVALVLAAGVGERLRADTPKAFLPVAGTTMLTATVEAACGSSRIEEVVAVVPVGWERRAEALLPSRTPLRVVTGGSSRQESVRLGLAALSVDAADAIVCHDAARPFARPEIFSAVLAALEDADGAVPVIRVPDTVKRVRDGLVVRTEPRDELALAQTPQAFVASALHAAHERAAAEGFTGTDDAALVERAGFRVRTVPGDPANFKVTTPEDLARAELLLSHRPSAGAPRA
jgi:2-C-methyl-D-erythritol 4-phosphate cytidylyltransferase/2-C-methyl-D-erythritol 2,4-cyclodiphosphate synthase